jgi:hypothetical protein
MNKHDTAAGLSHSGLDHPTAGAFLWHEILLAGVDPITAAAPTPEPRSAAGETGSA